MVVQFKLEQNENEQMMEVSFFILFNVIAFILDAVPVNGQDAKLPCNKWIVELVDDIKPEISELMGKLNWNILSPDLF